MQSKCVINMLNDLLRLIFFLVAEGCVQADRTRAQFLCKGRGSGRRGPDIHQDSRSVWWGEKRN